MSDGESGDMTEEAPEVPRMCQAARDGECSAAGCPQLRDSEPEKTGRFCPLPHWTDDPEW